MIKESGSNKQLNHFSETLNNDEVNLFELAESLWNKKLIIFLVTVLFMFGGFIYNLLENNKPVVYQGKIILETAMYVTQDMEVKNLYTPSDLAIILSTLEGVNAIVPRKSTSLVEVIVSDIDKNEIRLTLDKVLKFINQRDTSLINKLGYQQIIQTTQPIGEAEILEKVKTRRTLLILFSTILGFMIGVFIALILNALSKKQQIN